MLFNGKAILVEEYPLYYLLNSKRHAGVDDFPSGICCKRCSATKVRIHLLRYCSSVRKRIFHGDILISIFIHTHTHTQTHNHAHTHTHTHTHTYIYIYIYIK